MIGMLKRHEIQVLRRAVPSLAEVARLARVALDLGLGVSPNIQTRPVRNA